MQEKYSNGLWGKIGLITVTYIFYWLVFYGSWFLIPYDFFDQRGIEVNPLLFISIYFLLIPIISFLIPHYLNKKIKIKKMLLYSLHLVLIIFSVLLFIHFGLTTAFKNWSIG